MTQICVIQSSNFQHKMFDDFSKFGTWQGCLSTILHQDFIENFGRTKMLPLDPKTIKNKGFKPQYMGYNP